MKKIWLIGWKDVVVAFRDRAALILMLAAPFILTLGLALVAGRFSGTGGGLSQVAVVLVNEDGGQLGDALVTAFQSPELADLIAAMVVEDVASAWQEVDADRAAAAVIVPAGFTASIIPAQCSTTTGEAVQLLLYTNPTRPTSVGIVKSIVEEFVSRMEVARIGGQVAVTQLIKQGLLQVQDAARVGAEIGVRQGDFALRDSSIQLRAVTASGQEVEFDVLAVMAPGMALLFLMFTVSNGGRTLWLERAQGTLPRLLVSPTSTMQVLAGKVIGIALTGLAQMLILILASTLLFGLNWGDPLGVLVLVVAAVVGAVGWGLLITAVAKTPGQVSAAGSAVMLTFGILGGSFVDLSSMPQWFTLLSKITPNAWGLDGFSTLALGGTLPNIAGPVAALLVMGAVLFIAAVALLNRRGFAQA